MSPYPGLGNHIVTSVTSIFLQHKGTMVKGHGGLCYLPSATQKPACSFLQPQRGRLCYMCFVCLWCPKGHRLAEPQLWQLERPHLS